MKGKAGSVFRIAEENPWIPGCTLSGEISGGSAHAAVFSLAPGTQISPENYPEPKLWLLLEGRLRLVGASDPDEPAGGRFVEKGELYVVPAGCPVGVRTDAGCVYLELQFREDAVMNEMVKGGSVFKLADLVPYQDGKIVSMDVVDQENAHFALMSFDAGTGLSEHAAPGDALVFALDGEGIISYEGKEYRIKAGENFKFDKNGMHAVRAEGRFKMALLLVSE
ncbi:MAG: cupin domain-containing protein [Anaerovoracaceae bacterium]|jgi:quercetin dioxygenase-like cupin family protein